MNNLRRQLAAGGWRLAAGGWRHAQKSLSGKVQSPY